MITRRSKSPFLSKKQLTKPQASARSPLTNKRLNCVSHEDSLQMALRLAEHHINEQKSAKEQINLFEEELKQKNETIRALEQRLNESEQRAAKESKKYQKLKEKYRNIKNNETILLEKGTSGAGKDLQQNEVKPLNSSHQNKPQDFLLLYLSQQVSQCENTALNMLELVDVLEQKVQQLTMENSLLKGVMRERSQNYETSGDVYPDKGSRARSFTREQL